MGMTHSIKRCILHLFLKSSELHIKCEIWSHSLISDSNSVQVLPDPIVVLLLGGKDEWILFSVQTTLINSYPYVLRNGNLRWNLKRTLFSSGVKWFIQSPTIPFLMNWPLPCLLHSSRTLYFVKSCILSTYIFLNLSPIWGLYVQWAGLLVVVKLHVLVQSLKNVIVKWRSPIVHMSAEVNIYLNLLFGQVKACEVGNPPQHALLILL